MKHWRKSWSYDNIFGSSRFDFDAAQRGVWNDLLDLADISRVKRGLIAPAEGQSYTHEYIAGILNIPLKLLDDTLALCVKKKRILENGNGIEIVNWDKYQSDYDRQKPYRKAKKDKDYKAGKYGHMVRQ